MEGRADGTLALSLSGGKADLSGELSLLDLVLAKPGVPEIREPQVTIRPDVEDGFPDPRPNDTLVLPSGEELKVWAAPKISRQRFRLRRR